MLVCRRQVDTLYIDRAPLYYIPHPHIGSHRKRRFGLAVALFLGFALYAIKTSARAERARPGTLSDDELRAFVAKGYVVLAPTGLDAAFHASMAQEAEQFMNHSTNPGNNILPAMPRLAKVYESENVRGALASILGADYAMHAHRYLHVPSQISDQMWHKDSYWGTRSPRHHRPRWAMALYYPRRVTLDMGPTYVMPYSQYSTFDTDDVTHSRTVFLGQGAARGRSPTASYTRTAHTRTTRSASYPRTSAGISRSSRRSRRARRSRWTPGAS